MAGKIYLAASESDITPQEALNLYMPKIIFVSHTAGLSSGTSHSLLTLVKYVPPHYEVIIVVPENGDFVNLLREKGIRCCVKRLGHRNIASFTWFLLQEKPDLVYGNSFMFPVYIAFLATKLVRKPFIWSISELVHDLPSRPSIFYRMRFALRYADAIIANSFAAAEPIKRHLPQKEIPIVYNGIELADLTVDINDARRYVRRELKLPENAIVILNIGRVSFDKNQIESVEAIVKLVEKYPNLILCLLGELRDNEYVAAVKEKINQYGIQDHVIIYGQCNQIPDFLYGSDILLHTSRKETLGRVILEAMSARVPAVAYDIGGVCETIENNISGFLVSFGNLSDLAKRLDELIEKPELRVQMGKAGRNRIEDVFSAPKSAGQINKIIQRVLIKNGVQFSEKIEG
jgi:glycosyltransferase involved in cell wall biosynthesis